MNKTIKNIAIAILPFQIIKRLRGIKKKNSNPQFIYNIGIRPKAQVKVLICYVTDPFFIQNWEEQTSTRNVECAAMIEAFASCNCRIDVCGVNQIQGLRQDYDLIIGFGAAWRQACNLNPTAHKVLYLTEKPPYFSHRQENSRALYLQQRHGIKTSVTRSGLYFTDDDFKLCNTIICIGIEGDLSLLPPQKEKYLICPSGLKNAKFDINRRDIDKARKHFLWMGSSGAVHKGLDLVLDAFAKHNDLTLHVLGCNSQDKKLLKSLFHSNVIDHGFVNVNSDDFIHIATTCGFMVFPSCSEGVSTAVLTTMRHALIPLITRETSVALNGVGEYFADATVECIEATVKRWSEKSKEELLTNMQKAEEYAEANFTIANYAQSINFIAKKICATIAAR